MYASNRPTLGRRMLMTDEREITKDNIIQVVSKAFMEGADRLPTFLYLGNDLLHTFIYCIAVLAFQEKIILYR